MIPNRSSPLSDRVAWTWPGVTPFRALWCEAFMTATVGTPRRMSGVRRRRELPVG